MLRQVLGTYTTGPQTINGYKNQSIVDLFHIAGSLVVSSVDHLNMNKT